MSNSKNKSIRTTLSREIFTRFFITMVIFSIVLALFFVAVIIIGSSITWYDSTIYRILSKLYDLSIVVIVFCWVVGFIVIFFYYWRYTLGYIDVLVEASNYLVADNNQMIHLPKELLQVEVQMNKIKQDALTNARLAKDAEQRKNDLIVYLAHDLKTPLTSVIGYLTLLRDEQQISEEFREKYQAITLEKAQRLEDLINEFFEITRFNLTKLTLELSRVNLTRMLEQIVFEYRPIFSTKNLQCSLLISPNMEMRCDVNKLERVFDNLLRNAVNYSFENTTIEIIVTQENQGIKIMFRNHGNTIPEEKLSRIFEQFYRLDTARTSKTGGAGLGLAIAKEIVELHKGCILAYSENDVVELLVILPNLL